MSQQNLIEVQIPEGDLAEIKGAIGVLSKKLMPHLKVLTTSERTELPKMGDKTLAFVQKALEYGQNHEALVPAFLDLKAMAKDVHALGTLRDLVQTLVPITDALDDSLMLSGSEAYQGALVFYANVKTAAKVNVHGAKTVFEDLSARFPGRSTAKRA